VRSHFPFLPNH
jgi:hypothetical protein